LINIQNKGKNIAIFVALFMIATATLKIPTARALATPTIYVDPPIYTATHRGEVVNIDVNMENLEESLHVIAVEFKLGFDPTLLSFINVTEGPFMLSFASPPDQGTVFLPKTSIDYVIVGIVILPDQNATWHAPFPSGNGTLATISFEVTAGPVSSGNFTLFETKMSDTTGEMPGVAHETASGTYRFPVEFLTHHIIWDGYDFIITTESNSTISSITFQEGQSISFDVTGASGTTGYMYIDIPRQLMDGTISVLIGGIPTPFALWQNATYNRLYFVYSHSTKTVKILGTNVMPEFPSLALSLTPFVASLAIAIMKVSKEKRKHKP
jgi:hypothetical protein